VLLSRGPWEEDVNREEAKRKGRKKRLQIAPKFFSFRR
jgi:hypothetical protein